MIALSERDMPEFGPRSPYHQLAKIHTAYGAYLGEKTRGLGLTSITNNTIVHHPRDGMNGYQTSSSIVQDTVSGAMVIYTATYFIDQKGSIMMPPASISFGRDMEGSHLVFKLRLDPQTTDAKTIADFLNSNTASFSPEGETVTFEALGSINPTWNIWTDQGNIIVDDPNAMVSLSRHFLNWAHIQGLPGMFSNDTQTVFDPTELNQTLAFIDNSANPPLEQSLLEPVIFSKN